LLIIKLLSINNKNKLILLNNKNNNFLENLKLKLEKIISAIKIFTNHSNNSRIKLTFTVVSLITNNKIHNQVSFKLLQNFQMLNKYLLIKYPALVIIY
jgi:hypothetical protein